MQEQETRKVLKRNEIVRNGNNAAFAPARFVLRGLKAAFEFSKSSGNPMHHLDAEIVCTPEGEEVVEHNGEKVNVAGTKLTYYLPYTEKSASNIFDFFEKMGHPIEEIDPNNAPDMTWFKGCIFEAIISSIPRMPRTAPKPGEAVGDFIKGSDGKPIVTGYQVSAQLGEILGVSELPAKAASNPY